MTLDKNSSAFCCLAKLFFQLKNLDHNECNQQNAMELAETLSKFSIQDIEESVDRRSEEDKITEDHELSAVGLLGIAIGMLEHTSGAF